MSWLLPCAWAVLAVAPTALELADPVAAATGQETRKISVTLTVPSSAYQVKIQEVYQTPKQLWVLSTVKGGGIGAAVITERTDKVEVEAPELPVKHFVLGKDWNWTQEKEYTYLKDPEQFDKMVKKAGAKKIYAAKAEKTEGPGAENTRRYIVMYKKDVFQNGKTAKGETLEELARRHAKEFDGEVGRILQIINGYTITLTPENAARLGRLPEVSAVEEDRPVGINGGGVQIRPLPPQPQPQDR